VTQQANSARLSMNWAMMLTAISITVWQRILTPAGQATR
jgi:hypothetical protein